MKKLLTIFLLLFTIVTIPATVVSCDIEDGRNGLNGLNGEDGEGGEDFPVEEMKLLTSSVVSADKVFNKFPQCKHARYLFEFYFSMKT